MHAPVAVIDIGSNTIKLLVAARDFAGGIATLHYAVEEVRIARGIGAAHAHLAEDRMDAAVAAIRRLLDTARSRDAADTILVATSAVRDAENREDFRHRVRRATGCPVRILTGEEEANLIGRGLATDPDLRGLRDFQLFDLGGGSLECLAFLDRRIAQAFSLQLGCVRLTERCVADPARPFTATDRRSVATVVREAFASSGFLCATSRPAIATGGTVTTARMILALQAGRSLETSPSVVTTEELEALLRLAAPLDLTQRRSLPGLPPGRADVFPTALATILEVAALAGVDRISHSFYNLRYGVAAEALGLGP